MTLLERLNNRITRLASKRAYDRIEKDMPYGAIHGGDVSKEESDAYLSARRARHNRYIEQELNAIIDSVVDGLMAHVTSKG